LSAVYVANKIFRFAADGLLQGAYVYLLLCRDKEDIFVKIGRSRTPEKRFFALINNCPIKAISFSTIHTPELLAKQLEPTLHLAFKDWRVTGEWFKFRAEDKETFNSVLRTILEAHSTSVWPLRVTKISAKEIIRLSEQRKRHRMHKFSISSAARRDFLRHQAH
jgi:hypothetical protein